MEYTHDALTGVRAVRCVSNRPILVALLVANIVAFKGTRMHSPMQYYDLY